MPRGRPPKLKAFDEKTAGSVSAIVPECPPHLSATCRKIWAELVRVLADSHLLTQADGWTMERFCVAVEAYREAYRELGKTAKKKVLTGVNDGVYQNPWLAIRNKADDQLARLSADLGLDPKSRRKMNVVESETQEKPNSKSRFFSDREEA